MLFQAPLKNFYFLFLGLLIQPHSIIQTHKHKQNTMSKIYKTYEHNPPHLFIPNAKYFITGSTYQKRYYLNTNIIKETTIQYMFKSFGHYNWQIEDWVLLDNHYHLMTCYFVLIQFSPIFLLSLYMELAAHHRVKGIS